MAAGDGLFCLVKRLRSYQRRPILGDMADCEVRERFRLSRTRIKWFVNELGDAEKYSEKLPVGSGSKHKYRRSTTVVVVSNVLGNV